MEKKIENIKRTIDLLKESSGNNLNLLLDFARDVSDIVRTMDLDAIIKVCDCFKNTSEELDNSVQTIIDNPKMKRMFILGELNGIFNLSSCLKTTLSLEKEHETAIKNKHLLDAMIVLHKLGPMTHSELANELNITPQSLSMRVKRNKHWFDYIVSYRNNNKESSVIYKLNGTGIYIINEYNKKEERKATNDVFDDSYEAKWSRIKLEKYSGQTGGVREWLK